MPWQQSRPGGSTTAAKYRSKEHRDTRKRLIAELEAVGVGRCCIGGEPIYPGQKLHLDHAPDGVTYRGLACARHNVRDGAKRARARQTTTARRM